MVPLPTSTSNVTISVKAIDTGSPEAELAAAWFLQPVPKGREIYTPPIYAFLLVHPSGKRVLFDLGMRKGEEGLAPAVREILQRGHDVGFRGLVVEKLKEGGVSPADIDTVIWR